MEVLTSVMFKSRITILIILIVVIGNLAGISQQNEETKKILILFSLSPAQPAYHPILDGIRLKITEKYGDSYDLHLEYLDIENHKDTSDTKERFDTFNDKYREIKLDLLICVGRNAVQPIQKYAASYFLNLPVISIDLDFSNFGLNTNLHLNEQTTVIGLKFNIEKTLSTAFSLFPDASSVYFVGGTSKFDQFMMSIATAAAQRVGMNKKIIPLTNLSMDRILQQVKRLPDSSIVFVPSFNADVKLVPYHNPEAIRLISKTANSPVFAYSDMGFGVGAFGGYLLSFKNVGLLSGEIANQILNGKNPNSIKVSEQDYYEYVFDWRQLKRWNMVNSDLIPAGSTFMHEDISFVDKYKWVGGIVLLFIVLQTLLIANLIRLNRNQKLMTRKIIETENKYRVFIHEDRSLRLGQLSASLSHELNQPLTAILSNAQAGINFINSNEATPDLLKEIFQKIVDNDKRGAAILSSIRGMLKLESREKEKVNVNKMIEEVAAVYQSEANKKEHKLNISLSDEQIFVLADRIQIQQVLLNLIFNASQSMDKGGTRTNAITITQTIDGNNVIISVRDYGHGIDDSINDKLFKPFVTLKKDGMGIGLAICRSIIEDHNGKIWAESMPDGGAKFSFSLKTV